MDKAARILVYVAGDRAAPRRAQFVQSITGHFGAGDEVEVSCSLEENRFVLSRGVAGQRIPLKRSSLCPIKHLSPTEAAAIPPDVRRRGVDVGVAVLLQTACRRLLLTRRSKQLRMFPDVWVPPGGHVESGETLLEAGLRELQEETGLRLEPGGASPTILGLWESVFPPVLSRGLPQRHHVVVYVLLHSSLTHLQLQPFLSPAPAEVSACLWIDPRLVRAIVSSVEGGVGGGRHDNVPESVSVSQVSADGSLIPSSLPWSAFIDPAPDGSPGGGPDGGPGSGPGSGPGGECIINGTRYALERWLRSLDSNITSSELL